MSAPVPASNPGGSVEDPSLLIGLWSLLSFTEQALDGHWFDALGPGAHGSISYWPNGRMQVLIGSADRPRLRGDWANIDDRDKAACLDRLVAYAGRWTLESGRVVHHVQTCWIPNWEGRDLVRVPSFPRPGQLLLSTVESAQGRARAAQRVLWERVA